MDKIIQLLIEQMEIDKNLSEIEDNEEDRRNG
jgi:hypothetical protein